MWWNVLLDLRLITGKKLADVISIILFLHCICKIVKKLCRLVADLFILLTNHHFTLQVLVQQSLTLYFAKFIFILMLIATFFSLVADFRRRRWFVCLFTMRPSIDCICIGLLPLRSTCRFHFGMDFSSKRRRAIPLLQCSSKRFAIGFFVSFGRGMR